MLVVVGMIAALAGISFPVYRSIQNKVEKQKLAMLLTSLERAVEDFETEYNHLPYPGANYPSTETHHYWSATDSFPKIVGVLVGLETSQNFKRIKFLELEEAEGNGPGSPTTKGPNGYYNGVVVDGVNATIYNAYGYHYCVRLDHNMDGEIYCHTLDETVYGKKILLWTPNFPGWDKNNPDWIKSW